MKRPPLRALVRRLRPRTLRLRLTVFAALAAALCTALGAAAVIHGVHSSLLSKARGAAERISLDGGGSVGGARNAYIDGVRVMLAPKEDGALPIRRVQEWRKVITTYPEHQCTSGTVTTREITLCADKPIGVHKVPDTSKTGALSLGPLWDPADGTTPLHHHIWSAHTSLTEGDSENLQYFRVYAVIPLHDEQMQMRTTVRYAGAGALLLTFLVAVSTWLITGRALRPVEAIRAEFASLSAHHLDRRVPVPRTGSEIARLATTMNDTLDHLETAVDQQRQFVADASHELRTPLAALRAELELALNRPENAHWPQVVSDALGDTLRLQHLTTDLLLLARLDANNTLPHSRELDLADLVRDEITRRTTPPHITLVPHIPSDPVLVQGSRHLLARVLGNLLDNAERHTSSTIIVRLTHNQDTREAVLNVTDNGPGIPAGHHQRIFERFTRLDDARTRDTGGSGLGLAIAHRITTTHHGTLTITPATTGAHFTLRLPTHNGPL
jgi:signal transduction histidine kinase